jgi:ABC-type glycerol-3-phosphate transport system substrate-binding protein
MDRSRTERSAHRSTRRLALAGGGMLGAGALGALAAACSPSGGPASQGAGTGPALKSGTTIVYWNDQGGAYPDLMQRWGTALEQKTGVKVEATGGVQDYNNKLTAAFAAGSPPDVYRYLQEAIPLPAAVDRNMLLALDALVKRDHYDLADFRKDSIELYRWKGALRGLPRDYGLQVIYYNTDLFQRLGLPPIPADWTDKTWTFQKFVDVCVQVARGGERYALFVPRGRRLWASFVYSNGGNVVKMNSDGVATEFALAERPAVDALQLMQDLIHKHKAAPLPSEEAALGNQQQLMQSGKLAMQITNPSTRGEFLRAGVATFDVGVFPLGGASRRGTGGGGTGWGIAGPTKAPEEAWAFLKLITSRESELDEVAIGQTTPSRVSVATSQEFLDPARPPKSAKVYADGQEYVVRDPVNARWPDVEREVVTPLMNDQLWSGQAPAAQVMKDVKEKGDPYLK